MARSIIRDRIEELEMTNKQIIELLYREKGERITESKFSSSIASSKSEFV